MTVYEFISLFLEDNIPIAIYSTAKGEEVFRGMSSDLDDMNIETSEIVSIDNLYASDAVTMNGEIMITVNID